MPDFSYKPTPKPKESLKIVEVNPSSSGSNNSKKMVPLNVVTRAQKLKDDKVQTIDEEKLARSSNYSWKAQQERRVAAQKHKKEEANEDAKVQESNEKPKEGLIFVGQILETLKAMLDAYEARLRP